MIKLRCIVADDEPAARFGIIGFIQRTPFLEFVGGVSNALEIKDIVANTNIDLVFLDIEMPGMSGIDFLYSLALKPAVIIITAHPQYAVAGFELNVIDYLVKPVSYNRFLTAVNKVRQDSTKESQEQKYLGIKIGKGYVKLQVDDIDYIEARGNYVSIQTPKSSLLAHMSITKIIEMLPENQFIRIHKSYVVNIKKVTRVESSQVWVFNKSLPLSRLLKDVVIAQLLKS